MSTAHAQQDLLEERWFKLTTPNFIFYSQLSARQTRNVASELELWRQVAALNIDNKTNFPKATSTNIVYLFKNTEGFSSFTLGQELAFFYPTPRNNYMAFMPTVASSQSYALHQYAHFLEKNFANLRVPRWYEEGLAGYLARIEFTRGEPRFRKVPKGNNEILAQVSELLPLERLIYQDSALASPRMIQIANLKSEALLYYLLHGFEERGFADRRDELASYLDLLIAGRNPRFAFDQSFSVTTKQLDEELNNYLLSHANPSGDVRFSNLDPLEGLEPAQVEEVELTLAIAELALNTGKMEAAEEMFEALVASETAPARAYSGLGDALRFQETTNSDQQIARYFELALERAPDDLNIILDYGEYWESELESCTKSYPVGQRLAALESIEKQFSRAVELSPESPEANLAMAEFHLLDGQDWRLGDAYQQKAFNLLPADGFIMEGEIKYAIASEDFDQAERLIAKMAQPLHFFGEPGHVTDLRRRLQNKRRGENYDHCAE
ncbi:MAG: tetratricopeptide repeat protein [Pseudohongiellaceae bacterium]